MSYEFWNMVPCDQLLESINRIPSLIQRMYFLSIAEECRAYNEKYDVFLTFGEYKAMYHNRSSSLETNLHSDEDKEEPY